MCSRVSAKKICQIWEPHVGSFRIRVATRFIVHWAANSHTGSEYQNLEESEISLVQVSWNKHTLREATWEREDVLHKRYPHLFVSWVGKLSTSFSLRHAIVNHSLFRIHPFLIEISKTKFCKMGPIPEYVPKCVSRFFVPVYFCFNFFFIELDIHSILFSRLEPILGQAQV